MKRLTLLALSFVIFLMACEKDDFVYTYPELSKLLISANIDHGEFEVNVEFEYDDSGRLTEIRKASTGGSPVVQWFEFNEAGLVEKSVQGDYTYTYSYDSEARLRKQDVHYKSSVDDYEWNQFTEYTYKNGRISKAIEYNREGEEMHNYRYRYDSKGNTIEKVGYPPAEDMEFYLSQTKFRYDSNPNPHAGTGMTWPYGYVFNYSPDIKQVNNPVYSSYENMILSSIPPVYEISYEYDEEGLPVEARMVNERMPDHEPVIVRYEYRRFE